MNKYIEYTNLKNLNKKLLNQEIEFVNTAEPRAFVVQAGWVSYVKKKLNKNIKCVTVGGFPFQDIDSALDISINDLDEFDMVIPLQAYYKNGDILEVSKSIKNTKKRLGKKILKVILETSFIYDRQYTIMELVKCVEDSGADVIKTNTGKFNFQYRDKNRRIVRTFNDLLEDVKAIKEITKLPIKAAGGIRTVEQVRELINSGVNYIGTSGYFWGGKKL